MKANIKIIVIKRILNILFILISINLSSQTIDTTQDKKVKFDIQLFGGSGIYSLGISKNLYSKKHLYNLRLGFEVLPVRVTTAYATEDHLSAYNNSKILPSFCFPFEFTIRPNHIRNKFSFSAGIMYNFEFFHNAKTTFNDSTGFYFEDVINMNNRLLFSVGSDYALSKKVRLGLRLVSLYDISGSSFVSPVILPLPSLNIRF